MFLSNSISTLNKLFHYLSFQPIKSPLIFQSPTDLINLITLYYTMSVYTYDSFLTVVFNFNRFGIKKLKILDFVGLNQINLNQFCKMEAPYFNPLGN